MVNAIETARAIGVVATALMAEARAPKLHTAPAITVEIRRALIVILTADGASRLVARAATILTAAGLTRHVQIAALTAVRTRFVGRQRCRVARRGTSTAAIRDNQATIQAKRA